jgi:hemerythrin
MKPPAWHEYYVSGVARIDAQHHEIFDLIHRLAESSAHGYNPAEVGHYLDAFRDHIIEHFAEEDATMVARGYPELPQHRIAHLGISEQLAELVGAQNRGEVVVGASVMALGNVLVRHIQTDDLKMATWLREHASA